MTKKRFTLYNVLVVPKLMKTMILLRNIREFTLFGYLIN